MDKKANRQRNIQKKFFVSELENKIIEKKYEGSKPTKNFLLTHENLC